MRTFGAAVAVLGSHVALYGAWGFFWLARSPDSGWKPALEYGGSILAVGVVAVLIGLRLRKRPHSG